MSFFVKNKQTISKEYLFFFPHAGGAGENYQSLIQQLPKDISCQYAQLPGRGRRFLEPAIDSLTEMVDALIEEILFFTDKPVSFFGHSMGALIAFELARKLFFERNITVKQLFLSAHRAPSLPLTRPHLHHLPTEALFANMQNMGGLTDEGFKLTYEDLAPFYPTIYADFKLCELYQYKNQGTLPSALCIMWGENDLFIEKEQIHLWQKESSQSVKFYSFQGGHFYHRTNQNQLAQIIQKYLKEKQ